MKLIILTCVMSFTVLLSGQTIENGHEEECFYGDGRNYRGSVKIDQDGNECVNWSFTGLENLAAENRRFALVAKEISKMLPPSEWSIGNCRNWLGLASRPWCLVQHPNKTWAFCNISQCILPEHDWAPRVNNDVQLAAFVFFGLSFIFSLIFPVIISVGNNPACDEQYFLIVGITLSANPLTLIGAILLLVAGIL